MHSTCVCTVTVCTGSPRWAPVHSVHFHTRHCTVQNVLGACEAKDSESTSGGPLQVAVYVGGVAWKVWTCSTAEHGLSLEVEGYQPGYRISGGSLAVRVSSCTVCWTVLLSNDLQWSQGDWLLNCGHLYYCCCGGAPTSGHYLLTMMCLMVASAYRVRPMEADEQIDGSDVPSGTVCRSDTDCWCASCHEARPLSCVQCHRVTVRQPLPPVAAGSMKVLCREAPLRSHRQTLKKLCG